MQFGSAYPATNCGYDRLTRRNGYPQHSPSAGNREVADQQGKDILLIGL